MKQPAIKGNRLVIVEGLPGTGKTTDSFLLLTQMTLQNRPVQWIHEVAWPHPVLFFDEACFTRAEYDALLRQHPDARAALDASARPCGDAICVDSTQVEERALQQTLRAHDAMALPLAQYRALAVDRWSAFAARAMADEGTVYVLDSALFQYQIFRLLLAGASLEALEGFVLDLLRAVAPLCPLLLYLHRANVEDSIAALERARGRETMERMWQRDRHAPYYRDKPAGAEGFRHFLRDYARTAGRLYGAAACDKLSIDISDEQWPRYEEAILSRLGLKRLPLPEGSPPDGVYRSEARGWALTAEGGMLLDPEGKRRRLFAKAPNAFFVDCLPTTLLWDGGNTLVTAGAQIAARWTALGTIYTR